MIFTAPLTRPSTFATRLDHRLHLGKGLGGLYAVIADTLEPFGQHVLHHPANKGGDWDGSCSLRSVRWER